MSMKLELTQTEAKHTKRAHLQYGAENLTHQRYLRRHIVHGHTRLAWIQPRYPAVSEKYTSIRTLISVQGCEAMQKSYNVAIPEEGKRRRA
jgi:hypothetical protein